MRRSWILILLAGLLAGCSAHTRYAFEADVASYLGTQSEGTVDLGSANAFHVYLPDSDGDLATPDTQGYLADVPNQVTDALGSVKLDLEATLENLGPASLSLTAALYLAPAGESNIYQPQYQVTKTNLDPNPLAGGQSGTLILSVNLQQGDSAFSTVQNGNGSFRLGLELSGSGQKFHYRINRLTLRVITRPLGQLLTGR